MRKMVGRARLSRKLRSLVLDRSGLRCQVRSESGVRSLDWVEMIIKRLADKVVLSIKMSS